MSDNHHASTSLTGVVTLLSLVVTALPCAGHSLDALLVKALHFSCPQLDPEVHHGLGVAVDKTGIYALHVYSPSFIVLLTFVPDLWLILWTFKGTGKFYFNVFCHSGPALPFCIKTLKEKKNGRQFS